MFTRLLFIISLLLPIQSYACFDNSLDEMKNFTNCSRAAERGDPSSQYSLGLLYKQGEGTKENKTMAFKWFMDSAMNGFVQAQFQVGYEYLKGELIRTDIEEAYAWFMVARENGHPDAEGVIQVINKNSVIDPKRLNLITQRANDLYARTENKKGFDYGQKGERMPVNGITGYCDSVMGTVESVILFKKYGKPRSEAQQLIIGMTDPEAIKMMNGLLDWIWNSTVPVEEMPDYFHESCLAQNDEVSFIFQ